MSRAYLVLSDGRFFPGKPFGATGVTSGEIVFNTSMMGYQEILTDPSYDGQIVTMTYPLIGNVGVNAEDVESRRVFASGFVVKEGSGVASSWRQERSLDEYLKESGIVGIQGIDTRALTRHIRLLGSMPGIIASDDSDIRDLKMRAAGLKGLEGVDCVRNVTCKEPFRWKGGLWKRGSGFSNSGHTRKFTVVAIDLGVKWNILRHLENIGCDVTVVPATTSAAEIMKLEPDGVFLSNGPGDPAPVTYTACAVRELIGKKPVFGICLGHQILCIALGAKTYKLKFGHHGGNQPVMDMSTGKVEITSQNHNFAVDPDSIPDDLEITHINLNDNTVEGVCSKSLPLFSVQYHPEASPGPHDAAYLFDRFARMMRDNSTES